MTQNSAKGQVISFNAGGDMSGSALSNKTTKIQNRSVLSGTPTDSYVLTWVQTNNDWEAKLAPPIFPLSGSIVKSLTVISTNYSVIVSDVVVTYGSGSGNITVNLPSSAYVGRLLYINNEVGGLTTVAITPAGGTTLSNSSSAVSIFQYATLICYDGTNWSLIGNKV